MFKQVTTMVCIVLLLCLVILPPDVAAAITQSKDTDIAPLGVLSNTTESSDNWFPQINYLPLSPDIISSTIKNKLSQQINSNFQDIFHEHLKMHSLSNNYYFQHPNTKTSTHADEPSVLANNIPFPTTRYFDDMIDKTEQYLINLHEYDVASYPPQHSSLMQSPTEADLDNMFEWAEENRERMNKLNTARNKILIKMSTNDSHIRIQPKYHQTEASSARGQYFASKSEIDAVYRSSREIEAGLSRAEIIDCSKYWHTGQTVDDRLLVVVTVTAIVVMATLGAVKSGLEYFYDHFVHGAEFTCIGLVKAIYTGAVTGILGLVFSICEVWDFVTEGIQSVHEIGGFLFDVLEDLWGIKRPDLNRFATLTALLDFIDALLCDLVWAGSPTIRWPAEVLCQTFFPDQPKLGQFSYVKDWIDDEFLPLFKEHYGYEFSELYNRTSIQSSAAGVFGDEIPSMSGYLELISMQTGRVNRLFTTFDTIHWQFTFFSNQTGNYYLQLHLFQSNIDLGVVSSRSITCSSPNSELYLSDTISAEYLLNSFGGGVEGNYEFRMEIANQSRGWSQWFMPTGSSTPSSWEFEVRQNLPPSTVLECATLLGLTKCSIFVCDPNGTRPTSLYLTVDGQDQNLMSELPASGVDWSAGYTLVENLSLAVGVHTIRARIFDGQFTSYSGPTKTIRVGEIPHPEFPAVALTDVGVTHQYRVRFLDNIGGIQGAKVYIKSDRPGYITDNADNPIFKTTTDSSGWAYFYYTPLVVGQHNIYIHVDDPENFVNDYDIQQTSNYVSPSASGPEAPSDLQAWATTETQVHLSWQDNSDNEDGFEIERKIESTGTWSVVGYRGTNQTTYDDLVSPNRTYFYRIRAHNSIGYSDYSAEASVTSCVAPSRISLSDPYDGENDLPTSVLLRWLEDPNEVSQYDVYLGTTPDTMEFVTAVAGDVDRYEISNLSTGTQYCWKIIAHALCNSDLTTDSRVNYFSTLGTPGPVNLVKPSNLETDIATGVVLDWDPVSTPGTVLYDLYIGTSPDLSVNPVDLGIETQYLAQNLQSNTTYYWKVMAKAEQDAGLTSTSATWSFTTGTSSSATITLGVIKDACLVGGNEFANNNYGGVVGATGLVNFFECGNDGNWGDNYVSTPVRGAIQFDLSEIPSGVTVSNATLSLSLAGASSTQGFPMGMYLTPFGGNWDEHSITWNNMPSLDIPHRVTLTLNEMVSVWELNITDLVQDWIDGSIVNHGLLISLPAWEPILDHYMYFTQKERNNDGTGVTTVEITYELPCNAPTMPTLNFPQNGSSNLGKKLTLQWNATENTQGYRVRFGTSPTPEERGIVTANSFQVDNLQPSTVYYWNVEALASCDASRSTVSNTWSFTTSSCLPPDAVSLISPINGASDQSQSVTLTWNSVPGASRYQIFCSQSNPPANIGETTGTSWTLNGLYPDTNYFWFVRAIASCNPALSSDSAIRSFRTISTVPINCDFQWSPVSPVVGAPVQFTDISTGVPLAWNWQFGDGTNSDSRNPQHIYESAGNFTVTLTVSDGLSWQQPINKNITIVRQHGDVNGDGAINAMDLAIVLSVLNGNISIGQPPCTIPLNADFNDDGTLDSLDLISLAMFLAGSN